MRFGRIHIALFLMLAVAGGCSQTADAPGAPDEATYFPHPEGWGDISLHGAYVDAHGLANCSNNCHGENYQNGSEVSCFDCHEDYPHTSDWQSRHKAKLLERGSTMSCATECHKTDLSDCVECHEQYPHGTNWYAEHPQIVVSIEDAESETLFSIAAGDTSIKACTERCHNQPSSLGETCYDCHSREKIHEPLWERADRHGLYALEKGIDTCKTSCHGKELQGTELAPSCNNESCHTNYPHEVGWSTVEKHGVYALEKGVENCATECHGEDYTGGLSNTSCYNEACHASYPHAGDWEQSTEHGRYALRYGMDENCGTSCHGENYSGGLSNVSCNNEACHATYPHKEGWGDESGDGSHAGFVLSGGFDSCKTQCHGEDFAGGDSGRSCGGADCHVGNFPHPENWADSGGHNEIFFEGLASGDDRPCLSCHGADYLGGASEKSCLGDACHTTLSHVPGSNWTTMDGHGALYVSDIDSPNCFTCHDSPVIFTSTYSGVTPAAEDETPNCYQCHSDVPGQSVYPHTYYVYRGVGYDWRADETAHVLFISRNRELLSGPSGTFNGAELAASVRSTCTQADGCHMDGRYSSTLAGGPYGFVDAPACIDICHLP